MAHNINEGRIFYVGQKPWHGIGTELQNPATAKEAIMASKLDYPIELQPIFLKNGKELEDRKASVRKDTGNYLGVVGNNYRIVQNVDAFGFFDHVVGDGQAIYHTAGALGLGERIWILAKLPKNIVIKGKDVIEKYLVLANSHDGKSALRMYFTPVRVVCQNTLNASLKDAEEGIAIRHTGDINSKVEEARRALGLAINYYEKFEEIVKYLADTQFTIKQADQFFSKVAFGDVDPNDKDISTRARNEKDTLLGLFERGKGNDMKEIRHTAWTAYNAVTEYADHHRAVHGLKKDPSMRLNSVWFGSSARMKQEALDDLLVMVAKK